MNLAILDRPDEPAALARWLEDQLVGTGLADVAAGLAAVYEPPAGSSLTAVIKLGPTLAEVLARGLRALTAEQVQDLLRHPEVLLDLQEQIMVDGGPYWQRLIDRMVEYNSPVERCMEELQARLSDASQPANRPPQPIRRWRQGFLTAGIGIGLAAAILVAVFSSGIMSPPATTSPEIWGWSRPGAFAYSGPAPAYLERVADLADEWYREKPDSPAALARRIGQMREGCTALLLADLSPLNQTGDWLKDRCRKWAKDIDDLLVALEAKPDEFPATRDKMDALVHRLDKAIRDRAKQA